MSPLGGEGAILKVDPAVEVAAKEELQAWRSSRDNAAVEAALAELKRVAATNENIMPANDRAGPRRRDDRRVGRRAARRVRRVPRAHRASAAPSAAAAQRWGATLAKVKALVGGPPRFLVAKPGLDGHSNGAEQVAVAARDAGFEVIYQGIRLTPQQIADAARDEDVDVIGLSILSRRPPRTRARSDPLCCAPPASTRPVIVGGIIPDEDAAKLIEGGVTAVYTPKDYELAEMMGEIVDIVAKHRLGTA